MIEETFPGHGIIIYDPPRANMKRRIDGWCVIEIDREITRYYRWWVKRALHLELFQPSWDAHCSCVRGEKIRPGFERHWKKYDRQKVSFRYGHNVRYSGDTTGSDRPDYFWFVEIYCPMIDQLRGELGLQTFYKYHLTVGRTYPISR